MPRIRRVLVALAFGVLAPVFPVTTHAGGPAPGGGVGGGGVAGGAAASVQIDNRNPPGHNWGYLDFFPRTITVHQGDAVTFFHAPNPTEPHTVTFVPAGQRPTPQLFARLFPASGSPVPDTDDGAKAKGPVFKFGVFQPRGCGNSPYYPGTGACPYTGRTLNSGLLVLTSPRAPLPTWTVRMNVAPGVYHYFCLIHGPAMSGSVRVVPASAPIPSSAQNAASAAAQYRIGTSNALAAESRLAAASHPAAGGHTAWVVHTGGDYGRIAFNEFIPKSLAIRPGDTVTWLPGFHTVTFGNPNTVPPALDPECEVPGGDRNVFQSGFVGCTDLELGLGPGASPSGPPGRAYTGGYYGSGVLVIPNPHTWSAGFPAAGRFQYFCLVHPGMAAAIVSR